MMLFVRCFIDHYCIFWIMRCNAVSHALLLFIWNCGKLSSSSRLACTVHMLVRRSSLFHTFSAVGICFSFIFWDIPITLDESWNNWENMIHRVSQFVICHMNLSYFVNTIEMTHETNFIFLFLSCNYLHWTALCNSGVNNAAVHYSPCCVCCYIAELCSVHSSVNFHRRLVTYFSFICSVVL